MPIEAEPAHPFVTLGAESRKLLQSAPASGKISNIFFQVQAKGDEKQVSVIQRPTRWQRIINFFLRRSSDYRLENVAKQLNALASAKLECPKSKEDIYSLLVFQRICQQAINSYKKRNKAIPQSIVDLEKKLTNLFDDLGVTDQNNELSVLADKIHSAWVEEQRRIQAEAEQRIQAEAEQRIQAEAEQRIQAEADKTILEMSRILELSKALLAEAEYVKSQEALETLVECKRNVLSTGNLRELQEKDEALKKSAIDLKNKIIEALKKENAARGVDHQIHDVNSLSESSSIEEIESVAAKFHKVPLGSFRSLSLGQEVAQIGQTRPLEPGVVYTRQQQVSQEDSSMEEESFFDAVHRSSSPSISDKLLYHILGDPMGATSIDLVGGSTETLGELLALMQSVGLAGDPGWKDIMDSQCQILNLAIQWDNSEARDEDVASFVRKQIANSEEGQSCILLGRWAGTPGHAMVYEFKTISKEQGKVQLRIYNTGAGSKYHPREKVGGREMVSCLVINDIDVNRINGEFIRTHRTLSRTIKEWNSEYIYGALLPFLGGKKCEESSFVDVQRSGICTIASYAAFLDTQLSPRNYSKLQIAIGLQALNGFIAHMTKGQGRDKNINLAAKCTEYFSRLVLQRRTEGKITQNELIRLQKIIRDYTRKISEAREQCAREASLLMKSTDSQAQLSPEHLELKASPSAFACCEQTFRPLKGVGSDFAVPAVMPTMDYSTLDEIAKTIQGAVKWGNEQKKLGRSEEVHFELGRVTSLLRGAIEKNRRGYDLLPDSKKEAMATDLRDLGKLYVNCFVDMARRSGSPIASTPVMVIHLLNLIVCVRLICGETWEIVKHMPICAPNMERLLGKNWQDTYRPFENYRVWKELGSQFNYLGQTFTRVSNIGPFFFNSIRREVSYAPTQENEFVTHFWGQYGNQIGQSLSSPALTSLKAQLSVKGQLSHSAVVAALFSNNKKEHFQEGKREHLCEVPQAFFLCKELMEYVMVACMCTGCQGNKLKEPFITVDFSEGCPYPTTEFCMDWESNRLPELLFPLLCCPSPDSCTEQPCNGVYGVATDLTIHGPVMYKDLRVIRTQPLLQIDTAIATFQAHPELFDQEEWRTYFEYLLFSDNILKNAVAQKSLENSALIIYEFLTKQFELSLSSHQPGLSIYFLRQFRLLYERKDIWPGCNPMERKATILKLFDEIRSLSSSSKEYFHWHYERARMYDAEDQLTSDEIDALLQSVLVARARIEEEPRLMYDVEEFIHAVFARKDIQERLSGNLDKVINSALHMDPSRRWRRSPENAYTFISDTLPQLEYRLTTGTVLQTSGYGQTPLPRLIADSEIVRKAVNKPIPATVNKVAENSYSFTVDNTIDFRIEISEKGPEIYKKVDGTWYQFLRESPFKTIPASEKRSREVRGGPYIQDGVIQGNNLWLYEKDRKQTCRVESPDGQLLYEAELSSLQGKWSVFAIQGQSRLSLLDAKELPASFRDMEDRDYILPLIDTNGNVSKISFPHLGPHGLTFVFHPDKKQFLCEEFPHEIVLADQFVSAVPTLSHKLLLKNEDTGKKRVLIPGHHLESSESDPSALATSAIPIHTGKEQVPVYSYGVKKDRLVPETVEGAVYLAYTYLWQQQYEESARVLEQIPHLPLSDEALKILGWLVEGSNLDQDPKSIALRLKAAAILKQQNVLLHRYIPSDCLEKVPALLEEYEAAKQHCGTIYVTQDEAEFLTDDPKALEVTFERTEPIVFRWSLADKVDLPREHMIHRCAPSILNPQFSLESFNRVFTNLRDGRNWDQIRKDWEDAFGVELAQKRSGDELERIKNILSIASRTPTSQQQTAAAILFALMMKSSEFLNIHISPYTWEVPVAAINAAKKVLADELSQQPELPRGEATKRPLALPAVELSVGTLPKEESSAIDDPGQYPGLESDHGCSLFSEEGSLFRSSSAQSIPAAEAYAESVVLCLHGEDVSAYEEFQGDVQTFMQQIRERTAYDIETMSTVVAKMEPESLDAKKAVQEARNGIQKLLDTRFPDPDRAALQEALGTAGYVRDVGVNEATYALLEPFPDGFLRLNPALTLDTARQLRDATIHYLMRKTRKQQLQRALLKAKEMKKQEHPSAEDIQELHALMYKTRQYSPLAHPEYLVFEAIFGNFLRPEQIATIDSFLSGEGGTASKVIEMIMGAGKTSVLLPLITNMIAKRGKLSVAVFPSNLYPSMAPQVAEALQKTYSTQVFSWSLESGKPVTFETLKHIDLGLKHALERHQVVVIRPEDIAGLFLEFLALLQEANQQEAQEKIQLLQSIFGQLRTSAEFLFDEVDSVWDVLKEQLLTVCDLKPLDGTVIEASMMLFSILATVQPQATSEDFTSEIAPVLIEGFIEKLFSIPKFRTEVSQYQSSISDYLHGKKSKEAIQSLPQELRDILCTAHEQIHYILPHTCVNLLGVHYGLPPAGGGMNFPYAVPYETGVPVPNSRFGHELEEVNYTIQMFLELPAQQLSPHIESLLHSLQWQVRRELMENPGMKMADTTAVKQLSLLIGSQDTALSTLQSGLTEGIGKIVTYLSEEKSRKMAFIQQCILSKFLRPDSYFRVSAQIYAVFSSVLRGFSGTVWNKDTYPIPGVSSPESTGRTIQILSCETQEVSVIHPNTLDSLYAQNCGIIDVGGMLRGYDGKEIAQKILNSYKAGEIEGVIYYDQDKVQRVLSRDGSDVLYAECRIPAEKLSAYWSQAFARGADLRVGKTTTCTVCVGKDTLFKDFLQGVWRLRKLGQGQHIRCAITAETEAIVRAKLGIPTGEKILLHHLIAFTLKNQIERRADDNHRAVRQKADAVLQHGFVALLLNEKSPNVLSESWQSCRHLFASDTPVHPSERYGDQQSKMDSGVWLTQFLDGVSQSPACEYLAREKYLEKTKVKEEFKSIQKAMQPKLAQKVAVSSPGVGIRMQVQTQTQTETQTQTSVAIEQHPPDLRLKVDIEKAVTCVAKRNELKFASYADVQVTPTPDRGCIYLSEVLSCGEETKKFSGLIPKNLGTSINLHQIFRSGYVPTTAYYQPMVYAVLIQKEGAEPVCIAVNQEDADKLLTFQGPAGTTAALVNIHTGIAYGLGSPKPDVQAIESNSDILTLRVLLKVFSGDLGLTHNELKALCEYCKKRPDGFNEMAQFIRSYVCAVYPKAQERKARVLEILDKGGLP